MPVSNSMASATPTGGNNDSEPLGSPTLIALAGHGCGQVKCYQRKVRFAILRILESKDMLMPFRDRLQLESAVHRQIFSIHLYLAMVSLVSAGQPLNSRGRRAHRRV